MRIQATPAALCSASNLKNLRLEPQKRSLNDDEEEVLKLKCQILRLTMKTIITQW